MISLCIWSYNSEFPAFNLLLRTYCSRLKFFISLLHNTTNAGYITATCVKKADVWPHRVHRWAAGPLSWSEVRGQLSGDAGHLSISHPHALSLMRTDSTKPQHLLQSVTEPICHVSRTFRQAARLPFHPHPLFCLSRQLMGRDVQEGVGSSGTGLHEETEN